MTSSFSDSTMPPQPEGAHPSQGRMPQWGKGGRRLGRYIVGLSLGKGGMGEVFEAWDTLLSRKVALKLLSSWSAMAAVRFMQEATLQARVDHPHVCMVLDVDADGDVPFIAMQLVEGPSLLAAGLDCREIADVMQKVAGAIHAAHRVNLIHRDLKPSNILLERGERGGWTPYVCDFGLAKDLAAEALTVSHGPLGTPAFMAPEQQFLNGASVGPKTDIYGLGATLFMLLTGQPPRLQTPEASGPTAGLSPDLGGLSHAIPKELAHIITRCLAWHPEDRYPTAASMAEDLRRFLDGEPLQEVKGSVRKRLRRMTIRHPFAVVASAILSILAFSVGGFMLMSQRTMAIQARAAEQYIGAVKDLQYTMRIERMLPPHDLRPAFTRVRTRMGEIRTMMKGMGKSTSGPGHFALGWGHLLVREPQEAIREFKQAWSLGYQTSDVASAWTRALCEAYMDELPIARQSGEEAMIALSQNYLQPARSLLLKVEKGTLEPRELTEAHLELLDRKPDHTLQLVARIGADSPWHCEARVLEASALYKIGFARQLSGQYSEADQLYQQADKILHAARNLARSDETALKVELNRRLAWIAVKADATGISSGDFEELESLADQLLALNPEWLPAISDKLTVLWRRADFEWESGRDPNPSIGRGLAILAEVSRLPGAEPRLQRDRVNLCRVRADALSSMGQDPSEVVALGMKGSTDDEHTAELLMVLARWKADRGIDPTADLDRALAAVERPSFQNRGEYGLAGRRAMLWRAKAEWAFFHQRNPREDCAKSLEAAEQGLAANPNSSEMLIESALTKDLAYRISIRDRQADLHMLESALADAKRAIALGPTHPRNLRCLAQIQLRFAEAKLATGIAWNSWLEQARGNLAKARAKDPRHPQQKLLEATQVVLHAHAAKKHQS